MLDLLQTYHANSSMIQLTYWYLLWCSDCCFSVSYSTLLEICLKPSSVCHWSVSHFHGNLSLNLFYTETTGPAAVDSFWQKGLRFLRVSPYLMNMKGMHASTKVKKASREHAH